MAEIRRVSIRRERASFPAAALAFLVFSVVFFLAAAGVKNEKEISKHTENVRYETREMAFEDMELFLIALSDGESRENARLTSARYMQRGAAGYLFEKDGKWYSVGNVYFSKDEAEKMIKHISETGIHTGILPMSQKGVTLRVTAEEGVLDALAFCQSAFSEYEESLVDYSERLDAGALSEREARVLLSVLNYDLSAKKSDAEGALSASADNAAGEILNMYLELLETLASLTKNEGGEMMLSARIKYALIDHALKKMDFLKKLNS